MKSIWQLKFADCPVPGEKQGPRRIQSSIVCKEGIKGDLRITRYEEQLNELKRFLTSWDGVGSRAKVHHRATKFMVTKDILMRRTKHALRVVSMVKV